MTEKEHPSVLLPEGSVEVSRIMSPDDTNVFGNVHGGTIMKMIDEAGTIIATRHCNRNSPETSPPLWAALVRVERTDFVKPMLVGEVATVHADLTYSSKHSLEVQVFVLAEDLTKGEHKLTNKACLWYVPVKISDGAKGLLTAVEVPPLQYKSKEEEEAGRRRYEQQVKDRKTKEELMSRVPCGVTNPVPHKKSSDHPPNGVSNSASSLTHIILPSDCDKYNFCRGGVTMKLMDTLAGVVAYRHAQMACVTVSIDAIDFHNPVKLGEVMTVTGRITFTSNKSMEIEVVADVENLLEGHCFRALSAFFYFVALDKSGRPCEVPQLQPVTAEEKQRFEEGKLRYETRKQRQA